MFGTTEITENITVYHRIMGKPVPVVIKAGSTVADLRAQVGATGSGQRKGDANYISCSDGERLIERAEYSFVKVTNAA